MCGIIGIFNNINAAQLAVSGLKSIDYRGRDGKAFTDGEEVYSLESLQLYDEECLADVIGENFIGHCLHAVVNNVIQPIKGKGIIAANSEIYNWKELAEQYEIECENDSELILRLIDKYGIKKIEELDGDYACVYWINDDVYLFRDIFGVKPLWYSKNKGFVLASERKALEKIGYTDIEELNPRTIIKYSIKQDKIERIQREFFKLRENKDEYEKIKERVKGLLINAISKRIPDVKFGLLLSGGVDSSFIAIILKELEVDFKCYIAVMEDKTLQEAKDLEYAKELAEELGLELEIVKVNLEDVKNSLPIIVPLIESTDVTKVSVAFPFYFATKKAREDGVKVILSGSGSDQLFGGYHRYKDSGNLNKECLSGLMHIYEKDLYRDDVITMYNSVELRVPYLDKSLVDYALNINEEYKLTKEYDKAILRDIANEMGLNKKIAYRKKVAAQYGSNFLKAIDKLSKDHKNKSDYLRQYYNISNLKLGALFSSGKDSCYAMLIMKKQNYSIECLISMISKNKDSYMFHTPNIKYVKEQAEAMGIPIILQETEGEKENELRDLRLALTRAKDEYKIGGIVSGALFSTYQRDRIEKICDELGLKVFAPLWHKKQETEFRELLNEGFEIIVSSIAAEGLGENWLGRKLTLEDVDELVKLNKKYGINISFEGGEAESFVLDCPMFKKKIKIVKAEKKMYSENTGIYEIKEVEIVEKNNLIVL
ncbi:MAG: diphthine--ammonia ligase [Nanoarchaeota archaeon]